MKTCSCVKPHDCLSYVGAGLSVRSQSVNSELIWYFIGPHLTEDGRRHTRGQTTVSTSVTVLPEPRQINGSGPYRFVGFAQLQNGGAPLVRQLVYIGLLLTAPPNLDGLSSLLPEPFKACKRQPAEQVAIKICKTKLAACLRKDFLVSSRRYVLELLEISRGLGYRPRTSTNCHHLRTRRKFRLEQRNAASCTTVIISHYRIRLSIPGWVALFLLLFEPLVNRVFFRVAAERGRGVLPLRNAALADDRSRPCLWYSSNRPVCLILKV